MSDLYLNTMGIKANKLVGSCKLKSIQKLKTFTIICLENRFRTVVFGELYGKASKRELAKQNRKDTVMR